MTSSAKGSYADYSTVPIEEVRRRLNYDPETGIFTWRVRPCNPIPAGSVAGHIRPDGRVHIRVLGVMLYAHRLAWAITHGEWPDRLVDHKNRDTADNRLSNLRLATHSENQQNLRRRKSEGLKGASWCKRYLAWHACIALNRKRKHLGYFPTEEEAHEAYKRAAAEMFGEFARFE